MRRTWIAAIAVAAVVSGGAVIANPAQAAPRPAATPETSLQYVSAPGDWLGAGRSDDFRAPDATIRLTMAPGNALRFTVTEGANENWEVELSPGAGNTFHPGRYSGAERYPFQTGRAPGLMVSGNGRGCNKLSGSFVVNQVEFDATGTLTVADISVVQHCERATPALSARIRWNALPLSYRMTSEAGDWVGGGVDKTYLNSTSVMSAQAFVGSSTGEMRFSVSGLGDTWAVLFSPPRGRAFVPGRTYPTLDRTPDATHAGLSVGGNGRACNDSEGTIRVDQVTVSGSTVSALFLTFTQRCSGSTATLRGTVHYYA